MKKFLAMLMTVGALALGATAPDLSLAQGTPAAEAKKDEAKAAPAAAEAKKDEAKPGRNEIGAAYSEGEHDRAGSRSADAVVGRHVPPGGDPLRDAAHWLKTALGLYRVMLVDGRRSNPRSPTDLPGSGL